MNFKSIRMIPFAVALSVGLFSVHHSSSAEATDKVNSPEFKKKMQGLYQSLTELLNDVYSEHQFYDKKNASRIEKEINAISSFAHQISPTTQGDPSLPLFAGLLADQTKEAYRTFHAGQRDYARSILRAVPTYCLACHSRNATGPDFASLTLEPTSILKPLEKAEFYAATRQFDRAISAFQNLNQITNPYDIEKSIQEALLIAVRFKRDPKLALSIIQNALSNPHAPEFMKSDLNHWKKSVEDWSAETPRTAATEEGLHAEALRLIAKAREEQTYSLDHAADITYLRASTLLYDLLQLAPNGKFSADALLLEGMCYEVLNPRKMENLNNIYYEACIKQAPHSSTAQSCYRRYEQSIYFAFSGSSGTHLPEEMKEKLLKLWGLAN